MISFLGTFTIAAMWDGQWKGPVKTRWWRGGDTVWNEVTFDAQLFQVWWSGGN
jgi:hypothetical protein